MGALSPFPAAAAPASLAAWGLGPQAARRRPESVQISLFAPAAEGEA